MVEESTHDVLQGEHRVLSLATESTMVSIYRNF